MNSNCSEWDDDLPPEPEAAYSDLLRALKRNSGFGLYFVQCTPVEADYCINKVPQDMPQKKIAVLRYVEEIDNLYQRVNEFVKDKQIDILLIKGLEYSLYKYEKRSFGEITESKFSNISSVPRILNHLNQQRERFRDDFSIRFVFLLRSFSLNYLIHRAPDFYDWRSGVFELPTTPEVVEQESTRLMLEGDYEEYLKLTHEQKIDKALEIQDLLREQHQTENRKASLLFELGKLLYAANEYEAAIASYDAALKFKPNYHKAWNNRGIVLGNLGRYEDAIASFEEAIKFKPDYHIAWNRRGIALGDLGHYEDAIASFEEAIKFKPDFQIAWNCRGIALGKLGRYEDAISSFEEAINFKPDFHIAWNRRGIALGKLGRYEDAISSFEEALKFKPDFHIAWYNKACYYTLQGNIEQALENLQQAINLNPEEYREMAKTDSDFDGIRNEKSFQDLIQ